VKKVVDILKSNDSEFSLKLREQKDKVEEFIKNQKSFDDYRIRENIKELSDDFKELIIYNFLRDGLLKSIDFSIIKINSLKELVFNLEVK